MDLQSARALAEAGIMPITEYIMLHGAIAMTENETVQATAEPVTTHSAILDYMIGPEGDELALVKAQLEYMGVALEREITINAGLEAENKRLREANSIAREYFEDRLDIDNNGGPNAEMSALNEMLAALGEIP
jgi:hypothetical protein